MNLKYEIIWRGVLYLLVGVIVTIIDRRYPGQYHIVRTVGKK